MKHCRKSGKNGIVDKMRFISQTKKQRIVFGSILLIIIGVFLFVDLKNDVHISFSKESGYYDEAIELKILGSGGNRIYYTLDGSEPGMDGTLYDPDMPIILTDATANRNVYSARTDISTAFLSDLVNVYSLGADDPGYTVPDYNVDKCNVVRASIFNKKGDCLDTITGVYFIGFQNKSGYDRIYTASIVTNPENLFDYESGIYVTGSTFDSVKEMIFGVDSEDYETVWWYPYWYWWTSNYNNSGMEWEREAVVTIFDQNKRTVLEESCGIRIQGGCSRGMLPKSIGCYAREIYSGSYEFQTALFQEDIYPHKFVFFSGGDDNVFKLMDYLANTLEEELAFSTMDFIPCAVFLDGEYWGIYYITENYNKDYISDHYHVKEDNVIMMKNNELAEGEEQDKEFFRDMMEFISESDMKLEENYAQACHLIDMDSYIDYYAAQIYIARNGDWPESNYAIWRTRKSEESVYGDCKWRWMLFDVNSGALSVDGVDEDTLLYVLERDVVFNSLYQNEEFRGKFARRLLYIGKETFAEERYQKLLDDYSQRMREPVAIGCLRFYNNSKRNEFDQNIENIRLFFEKRYDAVWDSLVNNMGKEWLEKNGIQK